MFKSCIGNGLRYSLIGDLGGVIAKGDLDIGDRGLLSKSLI